MSRPTGPILQAIRRGGVGIAYAVRSYQISGVHYVDVELPAVGGSWKKCPVVGGDNKVINAPEDEWDGRIDPELHPLVAIGYRSWRLPPLVFDVISNESINLSDASDDDEHTDSDQRRETVRDRVFENGGSKVIMDANGNVTFHLGGDVTFSLKEGMKITKDGDAGDRIATAGTVSEQLNAVIDKLNALIDYVQTYVATATAPTGGGPVTHGALGLPDHAGSVGDDDLAASGVLIPSRRA